MENPFPPHSYAESLNQGGIMETRSVRSPGATRLPVTLSTSPQYLDV